MSNGPAPGHVIFYQNCPTPLSAGTGYSLDVGQDLVIDGDTIDLPPSRQHEFEIAGPRFTINPSEIHAAYPPPNSQGPFESRLPMIVLQRRTLPWERIADPTKLNDPEFVEPWLALLLVEESEVTLLDPPECNVGFIVRGDSTADVPSIEGKMTALKAGDFDRPCLGIQIPLAKFKEIAPTREEISLLCHARQVNTQDKELLGQDKDGWFSVVVGNRLPVAGKKYIACLVSLEGHLDDLPTAAEVPVRADAPVLGEIYQVGLETRNRQHLAETSRSGGLDDVVLLDGPPVDVVSRINREEAVLAFQEDIPAAAMPAASAISSEFQLSDSELFRREDLVAYHPALRLSEQAGWTYTPQTSVRLITLARWSFTCEGAGDFESTMKSLPQRGGVAALGMTQESALHPDKKASTKYRVALDSGHVALPHLTRAGENVTAFYRGPLVPADVDEKDDGPYHTADQARVIDTLTGMENLGYAAAFEIGRLMALADSRLAVELLRWRRDGHRRTTRFLKDDRLRAKLGDIVPAIDPDRPFDPLTILNPHVLVNGLVDDIGPRIQTDELVGPLADPTGLEAFVDKMPGFDPGAVSRANGFDAGLVEGILRPGIQGNSAVLDQIGLQDTVIGQSNFDELVQTASTELGYLRLDRDRSAGRLGLDPTLGGGR